MKKLIIASLVFFASGSLFAQVAPAHTSATTHAKSTKVRAKATTTAAVAPMQHPVAAKATVAPKAAVAHKKAVASKAAPAKTAVVMKKDGTPDKRYKSSTQLKKDGTPDMRYKQNKKS